MSQPVKRNETNHAFSDGDEAPDAHTITLDASGATLVLNLPPPGRPLESSASLYLVHNGAISRRPHNRRLGHRPSRCQQQRADGDRRDRAGGLRTLPPCGPGTVGYTLVGPTAVGPLPLGLSRRGSHTDPIPTAPVRSFHLRRLQVTLTAARLGAGV